MLVNDWDLALLVVVGYVAIMALVRLMMRRRDQLLGEFRRQMQNEHDRLETERTKSSSRPRSAAG